VKGTTPGNVIALVAEDNNKTFLHRLKGAGADLARVKTFKYVRRNARDELFLLREDLDKLAAACRDVGDVRLITIDPITAYMGSGRGFDSHRATDVRSQLAPLKDFAEHLDICVVAATHPPKGASARAAIDSFIGSQAFIATARVGKYLVTELGEPDDRGFRRPTGRVLFTTPKTSDGPTPPTLAFQQEDIVIGYVPGTDTLIKTRRIVWDTEPIDLTVDEARRTQDAGGVGAGASARDSENRTRIAKDHSGAWSGRGLQLHAAPTGQGRDWRALIQAPRRGPLFTLVLGASRAHAGRRQGRQRRRKGDGAMTLQPCNQAERAPITEAEYGGLQQAYEFMNAAFFGGKLPNVMFTLQRITGAKGYFSPSRFTWRTGDGIVPQHELALNPDAFIGRTDEEIISTVTHEQVHCWQEAHGKPPKRHYHNREWAAKMITIGLMPSNTGAVGGKITGIRMTHYILPDGLFTKAFAELAATGWKLNLQSAPALGREGGRQSKTKFTCASCGLNVWGKPDAAVVCCNCATQSLLGDETIEAAAMAAAMAPFQMRALS
jgi:hypothetical protein